MEFKKNDIETLINIITSRRDVRGNNFLNKDIEADKIELILKAAISAPSVGYSQPWEFIVIKDEKIKDEISKNFEIENAKAKEIFKDREIYKSLKLEGIKEAPVNIAVLYKHPNEPTIGMTSIKEMGEYSVVCAIQNMWLMARVLNIGVGWISILNEQKALKTIDAPKESKLIAYLALGYVDKFYDEPELKTVKWKSEKSFSECVSFR
ncbi:MAG: 5,6-dimethylbenzimidazole synthase [Sulfurimonas sp. RIFOXYD12_FULL_33_39]|uniref:5,6-dimethylbenzimidazole synthase n=1 Tax=unclassified Sulfurimonas TaxID=2623549 RepID=UPI0008B85672|nr:MULTISPECIES: 5,6-dimethylbenzimidazole synthase [unclassified Sulfurimonas]OHE07596.1 MAG: 5,6-dimethylbenzimidazole synthase [Sulfurimonas sp. RIFCSPLOWO2_12_FULL_34_6]OHE10788.1 MAG: 5,6-dimethylbenzimidazole synthase [Sulfurimonas sp. RIFOXYD12_FULL_33_39]OHE13442.1 MAG: 5,6-dimethylbenzimidazole synthase [Sulfurimonas sp. RIFOXYD2_FULL_34_21]